MTGGPGERKRPVLAAGEAWRPLWSGSQEPFAHVGHEESLCGIFYLTCVFSIRVFVTHFFQHTSKHLCGAF